MIDDKSYFRIVPSSEKNFGVVFSAVFFLVGIIPVFFSKPIIVWSIATSLLFLFLAFFFPKILVVPNRLWNKFGNFLGVIISPIVMLFIFVSTFLPIGLIFKALGKDLINQKFDSKTDTYWVKRQHKMESMKKQF